LGADRSERDRSFEDIKNMAVTGCLEEIGEFIGFEPGVEKYMPYLRC
jgi:hypothetical protein